MPELKRKVHHPSKQARILIAVAVITCCTCVFASPMDRLLRQSKARTRLRNRPFNARSDGIALFELLRLLPLAYRLNGLELCLGTYHQLTRIGAGRATLARQGHTRQSCLPNWMRITPETVRSWMARPLATALSLGTGSLLGLPIDGKPSVIKALTRTLPISLDWYIPGLSLIIRCSTFI